MVWVDGVFDNSGSSVHAALLKCVLSGRERNPDDLFWHPHHSLQGGRTALQLPNQVEMQMVSMLSLQPLVRMDLAIGSIATAGLT